ncbi:MAG TPA: HEPN domain-containing protein [Saprospiraceae bacterium]|nr:HEPN domain-containing protein [Saprospiraceae bacterium]
MTKQDHIAYWLNMSRRDWETVDVLYTGGRFLHALFFVHLALEKLLKAHWVKDNLEDIPPAIHNLVQIYDQTELDLSTEETDVLQGMNQYNITGRYQDYKDKAYQRVTQHYANEKIQECKVLRDTLLRKLQ